MVNFHKPLHEMSEKEINDGIQNFWPVEHGALGVMELLRRQQAEYAKQDAARISKLVKEMGVLKKATTDNAHTASLSSESSTRLGRLAIKIAIAGIIAQVLLSIHWEIQCPFGSGFACYAKTDLGILGTWPIPITFGLPPYP